MNAVIDNPFRILGLLANCSERELVRQVSTISRYADIGKSVESENDFGFIGELTRTTESVKAAAAKLEQPAKKLHWSLFWFINATHFDDTAFGHLRTGNPQKAAEIWSLVIKDKTITKNNYSSALNLSTLQIGLATGRQRFDLELFKGGVRLKGRFLESEAFTSFVELAVGHNAPASRERASNEMADELLHIVKPFLDKPNGLSTKQFMSAFSSFPADTNTYLSSKFTRGPVSRIETAVEETKTSRVEDPANADSYGFELYENTQGDLSTLVSVIGSGSVQYQILVNRVAQEILQCSIDYFNEHVEDYDLESEDPGPAAMGLMELARLLEPTGEVKHRLDENAPTIEKWVSGTDNRQAHLKCRDDIDWITSNLAEFQDLPDNPRAAKSLILNCTPRLARIKAALGENNELYLRIRDAVTGNALGMTITAVNQAQEGDQSRIYETPSHTVERIRSVLSEAWTVMCLLGEMALSNELARKHFANRRILVELMREFGVPTISPRLETKKDISLGQVGRSVSVTSKKSSPDISQKIIDFVLARPGGVALGALIALAIVIGMFNVLGRLGVSSDSNANVANSAPPGMAFVPGKTHMMGRSLSGHPAEEPSHWVTVKSFYIDIYETTNADYLKFVTEMRYRRPSSWAGGVFPAEQANFPVVGVNYQDAVAYARWKGKRLPTEEEWELAARAEDQRIYPWGSAWTPGYANADSIEKSVASVGTHQGKSPYGLFDMIGNAWEWTSSDFKPYPGGTLPKAFLGKKDLKTIRGGSFSTPRLYATSTSRIGWPATGADNYDATGIRCAMDAPQ